MPSSRAPAPEQPETPSQPRTGASRDTAAATTGAVCTDVLLAAERGGGRRHRSRVVWPSTKNRLPLFKEICPDDDANQAPPPPAPPCP